ncbi:cylicin-2-like [Homalodisca vitripennis]|uniref:cylicin-2-like n=1 Tax=Homalodisca vitripennis TaxID=197043 RepID=UPI001EEAA542|nr:cylicin-2-like [Homalodisca vitripennis]
MLATIRLARRVRPSSLILYGSRLPPASPPLALPSLHHPALYSNRPKKSKTQICTGSTSQRERSRSKSSSKGNDGKKKGKFCSKKEGKVDKQKSKTKMCEGNQQKKEKDVIKKNKKESDETTNACKALDIKDSDKSEGFESSEEEYVKAAEKECSDAEISDLSDNEETQIKAASEMCDCVKEAIAKSTASKKGGGRPVEKPCSRSSFKEKGDKVKPKVSEHVRCCNVEKSKFAPREEDLEKEQPCKNFKRDSDKTGKGKDKGGKSDKESGKSEHADKKNDPCECIKKALEKCKKTKKSEAKEVVKEKESKKEKPKSLEPKKESTKKTGSKKGDSEKTDTKKDKPKKPDAKEDQSEKTDAKKKDSKKKDSKKGGNSGKPDPKKSKGPKSKKDCKKKPVVKCL